MIASKTVTPAYHRAQSCRHMRQFPLKKHDVPNVLNGTSTTSQPLSLHFGYDGRTSRPLIQCSQPPPGLANRKHLPHHIARISPRTS